MSTLLALGPLLAVALALMLVAGRRGWQPSAAVAVGVALVLRLVVLALAAHDSWQPYDFANDFRAAGQAVLHHADPLLTARDGGWHFLPPMAYVFAALLKIGSASGVSWAVLGRLVPVAADVCNVVLVGHLATRAPATRRLQYALNPLPVMVCAIHGQIEPVALAFGLTALLLARRGRAWPSGLAMGTALAVNTWPVLLVPGAVLLVRGRRKRLSVLAGTAAVPLAFFLTIPLAAGGGLSGLVSALHPLLHTRPVTGDWGWGAVVDLLRGSHGALVVTPLLGLVGDAAILAAVVLIAYRWRRADPVALVTALILGFLLCTARFGAQYLVWMAPFLTARPSRSSSLAMALATLWAGAGYLVLTALPQADYLGAQAAWSVASLAVVAALAIVLFERRPGGMQRLRLKAAFGSPPALVD